MQTILTKYFPVIALFLSSAGFAQDSNEETIEWSASRKLNWTDYKAKPNPASDAAATTTTYVGIEYKISNDNFSYFIHCRFSKDRSWGLHKTDYILSHEQGHFDIAEIFARKLHKAMSNYVFNKKSFQKDLKKIYDSIMQERESTQNLYDKETNHSINKEKQAQWLKKIESLLSEYSAYAGYP
ncbi:MAG: DUF922 domain-containing protein [Chitinophagales bacterium]|nr:DUF922 domain-containing protein [Chitinophagales bacterium]